MVWYLIVSDREVGLSRNKVGNKVFVKIGGERLRRNGRERWVILVGGSMLIKYQAIPS